MFEKKRERKKLINAMVKEKYNNSMAEIHNPASSMRCFKIYPPNHLYDKKNTSDVKFRGKMRSSHKYDDHNQ